jgi:hypothetical protein
MVVYYYYYRRIHVEYIFVSVSCVICIFHNARSTVAFDLEEVMLLVVCYKSHDVFLLRLGQPTKTLGMLFTSQASRAYGVLTTMTVNVTVFWDVMPYNLVDGCLYHRFGGTCFLHFLGKHDTFRTRVKRRSLTPCRLVG